VQNHPSGKARKNRNAKKTEAMRVKSSVPQLPRYYDMTLAQDFGRLFVEGAAFSDVKVAVTTNVGGTIKEEVLNLHRNVLAYRSEYFRSRLTGGYRDGADDTLKLQVAPGSSIAATKALLEFRFSHGGLEWS
jgi:hypothetical protein